VRDLPQYTYKGEAMKRTRNPPQSGNVISRTTLRMWIRQKVNPHIKALRKRVQQLERQAKNRHIKVLQERVKRLERQAKRLKKART